MVWPVGSASEREEEKEGEGRVEGCGVVWPVGSASEREEEKEGGGRVEGCGVVWPVGSASEREEEEGGGRVGGCGVVWPVGSASSPLTSKVVTSWGLAVSPIRPWLGVFLPSRVQHMHGGGELGAVELQRVARGRADATSADLEPRRTPTVARPARHKPNLLRSAAEGPCQIHDGNGTEKWCAHSSPRPSCP